MKPVYIHKIATVVPEYYYTQEFALDFQLKLLCDTVKKENFLKRVYRDTAIYKRHTVINDYGKDPSEYQFYPKNAQMLPEPSTRERNDFFIKESNRLSLDAVTKLFNSLDKNIHEKITHLITVSCTGFAAPGFDYYLFDQLHLQPEIERYHLGFMGCCAAFPAMKLAHSLCQSRDDARVLIVNVELCSLHYQQVFESDVIIANALFADGVSAALVSTVPEDNGEAKLLLHSFNSSIINNSASEMAWKIGNNGFEMKLSYYVPKLIEENINHVMQPLFKKAGITKEEIEIWAIHPGGKAILEKLEQNLKLTRDDLRISYDILWNYGNMSSATIMFVLEKILNESRTGKIFAVSFGPGLTIESGYLEKIK